MRAYARCYIICIQIAKLPAISNITYPSKLFSCHGQNSTDKLLIVVKRVKLRCRDMQRTLGRVAILEVIVERQEVNVMHHHVVTLILTQHKTNVQERGTVKPGCMGD